jgi:hypothetical protein
MKRHQREVLAPRVLIGYRAALARGQGKRGYLSGRRHPPNLVAEDKPQDAIGPSGNPPPAPGQSRWQGKLRDLSSGSDAPNLVVFLLGKPEGTIRSGRNLLSLPL